LINDYWTRDYADYDQLEQKVGQLPKPLSDRLLTISAKQLKARAIALLNFASIDDLIT
jgi:hypothetical protein